MCHGFAELTAQLRLEHAIDGFHLGTIVVGDHLDEPFPAVDAVPDGILTLRRKVLGNESYPCLDDVPSP